jgi:dTDP-4-dehydrorhamnose 3,5-epimerase-like enzyme
LSLIRTVELTALSDDRGSLVAVESGKTIPFDIKRIYYIFGTQKYISRGFHAHKALQQVAVCVSGSCRIVLDNGTDRANITLDSPTTGLLIGDMIWREMHDFSPDCVLLVLASTHFCESDYIRSYEEFVRILREK